MLSFDKPTEACQSVGSESWGYRIDEDYYTDRHLIRSIDKYLARDANYLLNVGPTPDGTIPEPVVGHPQADRQMVSRREGVSRRRGSVLAAHRQSRGAPDPQGDTLYVHLQKDPVTDAVKLKPLSRMPRRATLLNTGQPVECSLAWFRAVTGSNEPGCGLRKLPVNQLANTVLVVKLEFDALES